MTEKFRNVVQAWYDKVQPYYIGASPIENGITDDLTLYQLDVDSLDETLLIMDLEIAYNITITDSEIFEKWGTNNIIYTKFKDICDWVESKPKGYYKKIIN